MNIQNIIFSDMSTTTTTSMSSDPTLDFPQCPFGEFDFGKAISFTFDDDDAEPHFEQDSERPDWGDLPVAWDIFGADSLCNSEGNSVVEFPDAIEPNDAIEPLYNVKDVIEPNDATGVDAPSLTPKTTLKRVFVPSNDNYLDRQSLRDALTVLKKLKSGSICDYRGCVRSLVKSFDNKYTTPLSLCLPPLPGSLAAVREKLRVSQVSVVKSTGSTIVVKEMKSLKPGKEQSCCTFLFQNGEWVCGDKVLFFSAV